MAQHSALMTAARNICSVTAVASVYPSLITTHKSQLHMRDAMVVMANEFYYPEKKLPKSHFEKFYVPLRYVFTVMSADGLILFVGVLCLYKHRLH